MEILCKLPDSEIVPAAKRINKIICGNLEYVSLKRLFWLGESVEYNKTKNPPKNPVVSAEMWTKDNVFVIFHYDLTNTLVLAVEPRD